ncbi:hypothetical protein [Salinicola peritrichatus]|uniref:hypothetical protein n=1 Tax=Salinicola peritrichatus TaxID=1267424 RepID=UPI000DA24728|nr:hypothetical protein [Salinicola peritrichatus]
MANTAEKLNDQEPYGTELVELNRVEQALAELRARHGNVPDYSTPEGYKAGKASIKELTGYRTGTDKARLAITKPHRDFIERVNNYGKSLISEIEKLEKPHRDAKQAADEAEQRKKEERIARLRERLDREINSYLDTAQGLDSTALADLYDSALDISTGDYFDITAEAEDAKANVINTLRDMHAAALERERLAAEQAEVEAERRRLREEAERQEAERAELEELRRFKEQQEAAATAVTAPADDPAQQVTYAAPSDTPEWIGFDPGFDEPQAAHVKEQSRWNEALADLIDAGLDTQSAHAALTAIAAGDVRHTAFNQGV